MAGWWWLEPWNFEWLSHHIGNGKSSQLTKSYFFRGFGWNHQPAVKNHKNPLSLDLSCGYLPMSRQTQGSSTGWSLELFENLVVDGSIAILSQELWRSSTGFRITGPRGAKMRTVNHWIARFLHPKTWIRPCPPSNLVGGLEHVFFHILGIIIPTDEPIFQRGWNHQAETFCYGRRHVFWRARRPGLGPQSVDTFPSFSVPTLQFSGRQSPHK